VLQKIFPPENVILNKSKGTNSFGNTFSAFCVSVFFVFYLKNKYQHTLFPNHTSIWSRVGVTNQSCESEYRAIASHVVHYQADRMAHW